MERMTIVVLAVVLVVLVGVFAAVVLLGDGGPENGNGDENETQEPAENETRNQTEVEETADYRVTFKSTWSSSTHPYEFPRNPHFSGLIGATHNVGVSLWSEGGIASDGIKNMAETGGKSPLNREIDDAIAAGTAGVKLSGGGIARSPGSVSLEFQISQDFPLVSLVSMLAPSPDWFVGVAGLSLLEDGAWVEEIIVDLYLNDAGTDSGSIYASPNAPTNPREPISPIGESDLQDSSKPYGTFAFTRIEE